MAHTAISSVFTDSYDRFVAPLGRIFGVAGDRWFFLYILFSVGFALVMLTLRGHEASPLTNLRRAARQLFDPAILGHKSAKLDYRYAMTNHVITALVWIYLFTGIATLTEVTNRIFSSMDFLAGRGLDLGWISVAVIVFLYAFAFDTSGFFQHMLQHKIPVLWEFHKVHHSAEVLTPVTVLRVHPVGQLVSATVSALVYGSLNGFAFTVFDGEVARYTLLGANYFGLLYYTLGLYHLKHSHLWVQFPRGVREVFASPSLHLIHHSNDPKHYDKNYGFVFTFWDRVFGSYYEPTADEHAGLTLGVDDGEGAQELTTVTELYLTPFKRAWSRHLDPRRHHGVIEGHVREPVHSSTE